MDTANGKGNIVSKINEYLSSNIVVLASDLCGLSETGFDFLDRVQSDSKIKLVKQLSFEETLLKYLHSVGLKESVEIHPLSVKSTEQYFIDRVDSVVKSYISSEGYKKNSKILFDFLVHGDFHTNEYEELSWLYPEIKRR